MRWGWVVAAVILILVVIAQWFKLRGLNHIIAALHAQQAKEIKKQLDNLDLDLSKTAELENRLETVRESMRDALAATGELTADEIANRLNNLDRV